MPWSLEYYSPQLFRRSGVELILPSCDPRSLPTRYLPRYLYLTNPNTGYIFVTVPPAAGDEATLVNRANSSLRKNKLIMMTCQELRDSVSAQLVRRSSTESSCRTTRFVNGSA